MTKVEHLVKSLGVVTLAVWAVSAQAIINPLNVTITDNVKMWGNIDSSRALTGSVQYQNNAAENVWAGAFKLNAVNTTKHGSQVTIETFCTDVGVNFYANTVYNYTAVQFGGENGINPTWKVMPEAMQNASWLYNNIFEPAMQNGGGGINQVQGAGMQLAIWKSLYDTDSSGQVSTAFNSGNLKASGFGSGLAQAQAYLTQLNAARTAGGFPIYIDTWLKPTTQTQGMLYNNLTPVPEPTTLLAGALLLLPLGISTLRILRKNRAA